MGMFGKIFLATWLWIDDILKPKVGLFRAASKRAQGVDMLF